MKYEGISNKGLEKLLDKMHNDKDFVEQLLSKNSMEEMYNFASGNPPEYSFEEFQNLMKKLFVSSSKKLTEEEESKVNAGFNVSALFPVFLAFRNEKGIAAVEKLWTKYRLWKSESKATEILDDGENPNASGLNP